MRVRARHAVWLALGVAGCGSLDGAERAPSGSIRKIVDPSLALPSRLPPPSRDAPSDGEALLDSPDLATFLDRAEGRFGNEYLDKRYAAMPVMQHEGAKLLEQWAHDRLTFLDVAGGTPVGAGHPGRPGTIACLEGDRFVMPPGSSVPRVGGYRWGDRWMGFTIHAFGEVPVASGAFQGRFCGVFTGTVFNENESSWKLVGMFDTEANRRRVR